jgi:hypothetical protein
MEIHWETKDVADTEDIVPHWNFDGVVRGSEGVGLWM